ncbi:hypothetical protein N7468_005104 [Penicillium chermesinum]|uniref:Transaldolase n=1 Tax=Penicillium chermesinum TaxID=63820 RepID=A0A9W9TN17_9EURO|nr:uncharacterized protein N7468_005104 [Penicillium chermesinum]KAJ5232148.1 hypothetical protein N7468_005104 [Penicillium chermesinum]KAJ6171812.1 hypothetical protein N7470_000879 [Penicillium chermesinum]
MADTAARSWLDVLATQINVDLDYMDPEFTLSLLPVVPNDMTSNQFIVHERMCHPDNEALLKEVAKDYKDGGWLAVYTRMAVLMCKANINNIKGRVLLQTLPSYAYNTEKTIEHARAYAREFESVGISKDRLCIKIPATGPALSACPILLKEGIRTLGTAVFSVHQAVAASQAGCLYISPYYNEILAHLQRQYWPKSADPALLHPFSSRFIQIVEVYRRLYQETGKEQPFIKQAGFLSAEEAMAAAEIGCHSATIPRAVLQELADRQYDSSKQPGEGLPKSAHPYIDAAPVPARLKSILLTDPLDPAWKGEAGPTDIDYLADNGAKLDAANKADPETNRRLAEAIEAFIGAEKQSQAKIEEVIRSL